ncbi:Ribonuclease P protein component [Rubripirellula lacrimiformis]|uniref:Ribonuclease P protein component n=1 Tax=Rubripirellula lacrimiformis TaxID=1930273 RepID=A0A517NG50_9BACT|nr:ribonuclease P protein component [Rubripirellula lacrimiformis]QDT06058.1 Ribonuclease P protein component [Rubripirellula lacrimiformis]
MTIRYTFGKQQRVRKPAEFTLALRRGSCAADGVLVLFAIQSSEGSPPRLGVTIPKKTGNAVARNRWKRWIRESFRLQQDKLPTGHDFVVRPKKDAKPSWAEIKKSVPRLATKAVKRIGQPK